MKTKRTVILKGAVLGAALLLLAIKACASPGPVTTAPGSGSNIATPAVSATTPPDSNIDVARHPDSGAATALPRRGGKIRYATAGDPQTLDVMVSPVVPTGEIMVNVYEALFALDSNLTPQPSLATNGYRTENRDLRWVIPLRKGVHFHDGSEMTSADVVASLNRWGRMTEQGKRLFNNLVRIDMPDRYTVLIDLKKPMPVVPNLLAIRPGRAAIYPKAMIDAVGDNEVTKPIGTGPYRFATWKKGQYIELARFENYQPRSEPADGMAGRREAYADTIRFIPVPEPQKRLQGMQTGLYDLAADIPPDLYAAIQTMPSLDPVIVKPFSAQALVFNKNKGIFTDLKARQAVQAALNFEPMLRAAFGTTDFYRLDPGLFSKETRWWTDAGKSLYNQNNPDKARQLLDEIGYRGEAVRVLTTKDVVSNYQVASVLKNQLAAVGMPAALDLFDYATWLERGRDPSAYDIWIYGLAGWTSVSDPVEPSYWEGYLGGWWVNQSKDTLIEGLLTEGDYRKRLQLVSKLQQLVYEEAPMIKVGDSFLLKVKSKQLQGPGLASPIQYLFNAWLSK